MNENQAMNDNPEEEENEEENRLHYMPKSINNNNI